MKNKYSDELIHKALAFLAQAQAELGEEQGQEKVEAMFDAFDPGFKNHLLLKMLSTYSSGPIFIYRKDKSSSLKFIEAIKSVRAATGFGLREAKDVIDNASNGQAFIGGNWSYQQKQSLAKSLEGTGFEIR